jgi:Tol biopolymer transport system component
VMSPHRSCRSQRRRSIGLLILLVTALLVVGLLAPAPAAGSQGFTDTQTIYIPLATKPRPQQLAFTSWRDGHAQVYVMNTDGSYQTNLSNNATIEGAPAWSPDGAKIAFLTRDVNGDLQLAVMNADGSDRTQLTTQLDIKSVPIWSPDGTKIAFTSMTDTGREIYSMHADGTGLSRLTHSPQNGWALDPAWSPDGTKIAYLYYGGSGTGSIYAMNPDGSGQAPITSGGAYRGPAWSPDGKKVAFVDYPESEIAVVNADGSGRRQLTHIATSKHSPVWSPDGQRLAFNAQGQIWLMNADGSGQHAVTGKSSSVELAWSPDGNPNRFHIVARWQRGDLRDERRRLEPNPLNA